MAYIKNNWVDREGTTRYFETVDDDGALILTPDYTQVTELGTPVNADNMNHIEEGIAAGSFTKFDLNTTYAKDDLVTFIEEASPVIYKSLQDNNIGNDLSYSAYWEKISLGGGGLEIGDIGFTQMAIDESKGKRRILNGQLIIQDQYVEFTNIIKNSVALNPDLACTEAEWQTAVTMSEAGICYKFVIDDEAGTIRLPKYPTYFDIGIDGTKTVSVYGTGKALGFYDNQGHYGGGMRMYGGNGNAYVVDGGYNVAVGTTGLAAASSFADGILTGVTPDPTKSGLTGSVDVESEQIKVTYFIQVATGAETEDNIINEIELNNPFSLLDYKYSEYELNNLSWLRSNSQYNSKAVYPAVYELLLKIYNGTETKAGVSVKLSTEAFTDYDFVLNTAEETFRLPTKTGIETSNSDLYLYFYVGETVQNANLINAGRIEEKVASLIPNNSSLIASYGMPSSRYIDLTLGASGTTYTAPANGWVLIGKRCTANQYLGTYANSIMHRMEVWDSTYCSLFFPVRKGDVFPISYTTAGTTEVFRFVYAEGDQ